MKKTCINFNFIFSSFLETNRNQTESESVLELDDKSARPRFIKSSTDEPLGMDSLTIIWYLTTFTALLGFFVVMACTEKSCSRTQTTKPPETRTCPPTPCPSYKNFAPPSYDTVMKKYKNQRVFIVPVHDGSNFFNQSLSDSNVQHQTMSTSVVIEKNTAITVW